MRWGWIESLAGDRAPETELETCWDQMVFGVGSVTYIDNGISFYKTYAHVNDIILYYVVIRKSTGIGNQCSPSKWNGWWSSANPTLQWLVQTGWSHRHRIGSVVDVASEPQGVNGEPRNVDTFILSLPQSILTTQWSQLTCKERQERYMEFVV